MLIKHVHTFSLKPTYYLFFKIYCILYSIICVDNISRRISHSLGYWLCINLNNQAKLSYLTYFFSSDEIA